MRITTVRKAMLVVAFISFSLAVSEAMEQETFLALTHFSGTLLCIFFYSNPEALLVTSIEELDRLIPDFVELRFLWTALAIGCSGVIWELYQWLE